MSVHDHLNYAINETNNLNYGEIFLVKNLFKGYEWKRIQKSERMKLGTLFLYEVQEKHLDSIQILGKTSSNQQQYMKIK